jgi:hypothetical protein
MASRTEMSLEELLAEPIVKQLMCRDGVSMNEARALYAAVAARLEGRAAPPRSSQSRLTAMAWTGASLDHVSRCL